MQSWGILTSTVPGTARTLDVFSRALMQSRCRQYRLKVWREERKWLAPALWTTLCLNMKPSIVLQNMFQKLQCSDWNFHLLPRVSCFLPLSFSPQWSAVSGAQWLRVWPWKWERLFRSWRSVKVRLRCYRSGGPVRSLKDKRDHYQHPGLEVSCSRTLWTVGLKTSWFLLLRICI